MFFWYGKVCIFWKCSIHYTLRQNTSVKQIFFWQKCPLFFLLRAHTHDSFTFNLQLLYELKHKFHFFKTVYRIFHFWFLFVLIKFFIFCSTKWMDTLTLKCHYSFQSNKKARHSFARRPLTFKLQQKVLKFNDICVSWSSPKADLTWWQIF